MNQDADDFDKPRPGPRDDDPAAAERLPRRRALNGTIDLVRDLRLSIFANLAGNGSFEDPETLVAHLTWMAQDKAGEVQGQATSHQPNLDREPLGTTALKRIIGTEIRVVHGDRPTVRQQLLALLRQGLTYHEIADHLSATEKNIRRLVRHSKPETQPCPPS